MLFIKDVKIVLGSGYNTLFPNLRERGIKCKERTYLQARCRL